MYYVPPPPPSPLTFSQMNYENSITLFVLFPEVSARAQMERECFPNVEAVAEFRELTTRERAIEQEKEEEGNCSTNMGPRACDPSLPLRT